MSKLDQLLRTVAAFVLVILFYTGTVTGTLGIIGLVVASILLVTALFGSCPLYTLIGIRSCPNKP